MGRLLDRTQAEQAALLEHHHLGLADIQRVAGPDIGFDTATVFESYPIDRGGLTADTDLAGIRVVDVTGVDATHYPLSVAFSVDTQLRMTFHYLPDVIDEATVDAIAGRVTRVFEAMASDPDVPLVGVDLLGVVERGCWCRCGVVWVWGVGCWRRFWWVGWVMGWGGGVVWGVELSYGELDVLSSRWARVLIGRGVGPEMVVAVGWVGRWSWWWRCGRWRSRGRLSCRWIRGCRRCGCGRLWWIRVRWWGFRCRGWCCRGWWSGCWLMMCRWWRGCRGRRCRMGIGWGGWWWGMRRM
ncbi:hypothetical protein FXW78_36750 [Rhodococcus opacus]|nr:hypothetical protein [Rhodococcus opacus]